MKTYTLAAIVLMGLYLLIACWHGYNSYQHMKYTVLQEIQHDRQKAFLRLRTPKCLRGQASQSGFDCRAIFENSNYLAKEKTQYHPPNRTAKCELEQLVQDCSLFKKANGYAKYARATDARDGFDFPIAFGIKLHKWPLQAEQLLRTIYHPKNVYCIHIDKKSPKKVQNLFLSISRCFDNVHVIRDNIELSYATFDHIVVEMILMRTCRQSKQKWKYYINLTGQDFPLKTNWEIIQILKLLNGSNDIESYPFPEVQLQERIVSFRNQTIHPVPYGIKLYKGSAYGTFSRKFVDFLLNNHKAKEVMWYFNNTKAPEETVWATLNRLPKAPGGASIDTRHSNHQHLSKAVLWQWERPTCHGHYSRSVCVFSAGDLMWLKSRPELFANKFDYLKDPVTLDCLEEEIRNRTERPIQQFSNLNYYRHLPQVLQNIH